MKNELINNIQYELDEKMNMNNIIRYGISFEEALTVFKDSKVLFVSDIFSVEPEANFIALGRSNKMQTTYVCYCKRNSNVVRIISVRNATKAEKIVYEKGF